MKNLKSEKGQAMVEYGIIVTLVSLLAVSGLNLIGDNASEVFTNVREGIGVNETDPVINTPEATLGIRGGGVRQRTRGSRTSVPSSSLASARQNPNPRL